MSLTDTLFGTSQSHIDREVLEYNPRTQEREKSFGDRVGDLLTGQGSVIDAGVRTKYVNDLKETYGNRIDRVLKALPNLSTTNPDALKITDSTIGKVLDDKLTALEADAAERSTAINLVRSKGYGDEIGTKTTDQLYQFMGDKSRAKEKETKDETREIRRLENAINNRRLDIQQSQLTGQQAYENRRLDMQDARDARSARDKQLMMIIQGLNAFGQGFQ
jgi:hypothetical protein